MFNAQKKEIPLDLMFNAKLYYFRKNNLGGNTVKKDDCCN